MKTLVGLVVVVGMALLVGVALADSRAEKAARDQSPDPSAYTTVRADRNGGDNCADAVTITTAFYNDSGNTTGYTDDWRPVVDTYLQDGEDQAYRIVITTAGTIDVAMTPTGYDCSVYIIGEADCANSSPTVLAGADTGYSGDPETISYAASPGTYYIIADAYNPGIVGPFVIEVTSNVPVELEALTAE